MSKSIIIIIVVIALLAVGGYFMFSSNTKDPITQNNNQQNQTDNNTVTPTPQSHEIIYSDNGYAPAELRIKVGDTVVFKNQSSGGMWTASAMHPTHSVYGGTSLQDHCPDIENDDFDQCKSSPSGESWSFNFSKTGTFGYHSHVKANHFGKIIVE